MTGHAADPRDAERAFERALIGSARDDAPAPGAADAAWARFAGASATLATLAAVKGSSAELPGSGASVRSALQWLAVGALCGGSIVAAWFGLSARAPDALASATVAPASAAPPAAPEPARGAEAPPAPAEAPEAPPPDPAPTPVSPPSQRPRALSLSSEWAGGPAATPAPRRSTLSAEIALLDAARTAIGIGAHAEALRLIERHRREFPNGELRREGDVLALEALAERGDRTEAGLRARGFLERFPDDPQAGRVRAIERNATAP